MKLTDINTLVGEIIQSFQVEQNSSVLIVAKSGRKFRINLYDDGGGGNDSHASIGSVNLNDLIGKMIHSAYEESKNSSQAVLILKTKRGVVGSIVLNHEDNGYYDFSYDIEEI